MKHVLYRPNYLLLQKKDEKFLKHNNLEQIIQNEQKK